MHDSRPVPDEVVCRLVERDEIEPALRLILAGNSGSAGDEQVLDFLSYAVERNIDVNQLWVATRGGSIVWAMLPVVSPGKTMLLISPSRVPSRTPEKAVTELATAICRHWSERGVQMAQVLLDPSDQPVLHLYRNGGFRQLAELLYLQRTVRSGATLPALASGLTLETYSSANHADFKTTIQRSYTGSMDCPEMNGTRDPEDVVAGHRDSGEHEPSMWFLVRDNGAPVATLLLTRATQVNTIELVYLGVIPEARGRGIADWLLKLAVSATAKDGKGHLSLAVDSRNTPALRLYYRHGLAKVGSRVAMIRDLGTLPKENLLTPEESPIRAQVR